MDCSIYAVAQCRYISFEALKRFGKVDLISLFRLTVSSLKNKLYGACTSQRKQRVMLAIVIKNFIVLLKLADDDEKSMNRLDI
jgi:hypothetical protein